MRNPNRATEWAYDLLACGGFFITFYILLLVAAGL